MPASKKLACAVALALCGVADFAAAAPQQADPAQDAARQDAMPVLPLQGAPQPPQQTATPPDQGLPQDQGIEPLGPPNIP
jgi:hypothetical protein